MEIKAQLSFKKNHLVRYMNNDEKIVAYKKLMRLQKIFLFSFLLFPLFVLILFFSCLVLWPSAMDQLIGISFLIAVPIIFFNGIRLLAYDYCPWCGSSFFVLDSVGYSGSNLLFRKKCRSCGEPKNLDHSK